MRVGVVAVAAAFAGVALSAVGSCRFDSRPLGTDDARTDARPPIDGPDAPPGTPDGRPDANLPDARVVIACDTTSCPPGVGTCNGGFCVIDCPATGPCVCPISGVDCRLLCNANSECSAAP